MAFMPHKFIEMCRRGIFLFIVLMIDFFPVVKVVIVQEFIVVRVAYFSFKMRKIKMIKTNLKASSTSAQMTFNV